MNRDEPREGPGTGTQAGAQASTLVARDAGVRQLTDPKSMRALAHPTRLALVEALVREGPLTATEAAKLLDDSPGNLSWHLGVLAKYGIIEEVVAKGRRRPWRLTAISASFSSGSGDTPDLTAAGEALDAMATEQAVASRREWQSRRHHFEEPWREAAYSSSTITYLTPDELDAIGKEVSAVMHRYRDRALDKARRPPGSRPVRLTAWGHPLPPTSSGN